MSLKTEVKQGKEGIRKFKKMNKLLIMYRYVCIYILTYLQDIKKTYFFP